MWLPMDIDRHLHDIVGRIGSAKRQWLDMMSSIALLDENAPVVAATRFGANHDTLRSWIW
jgi:hypothetical protein